VEKLSEMAFKSLQNGKSEKHWKLQVDAKTLLVQQLPITNKLDKFWNLKDFSGYIYSISFTFFHKLTSNIRKCCVHAT